MDRNQALVMFAQASANQPRLKEWAVDEAVSATALLVQAVDTVAIYRAQGKLSLLNQIIDMLDNAHKHLR